MTFTLNPYCSYKDCGFGIHTWLVMSPLNPTLISDVQHSQKCELEIFFKKISICWIFSRIEPCIYGITKDSTPLGSHTIRETLLIYTQFFK